MYRNVPRYKAFADNRGYKLQDISSDAAQQFVNFIANRWLNFMNIMISSDPNKEDKFDARWDNHRLIEENAGSELPSVSDKCADQWQKLAIAKNLQPYTDAAWRTCLKYHFDYIIN